MIPLTQTDFTPVNGDCFRTCVASILECPPELLPNPHDDDGKWFWDWQEFFEPYNIQLISFPSGGDYFPNGYSIVGGKSPRGDWDHAVIYHCGTPRHDPHPSQDFTLTVEHFTLLIPIDPSKSMLIPGETHG